MANGQQTSDLGEGPATVTVTGDAVVRVQPDEAILWISLTALQDTPGPALADVSARSHALVTLLDDLGIDHADRSTTGTAVYEEFDHTADGRQSLGHRAVSQVSVRLPDPDVIGRLIAEATERLGARIDGPRWLISAENPSRLEAARQAAAASRRKAQAFAHGVGAELGPLLRLAEPDGHFMFRAASGPRSMGGEPMPIEPGEHEVTASVQATFALVFKH